VNVPTCVVVKFPIVVVLSLETCAVDRLEAVSASSEVVETAFNCVVVSPCA
jgi:hypothetical protein